MAQIFCPICKKKMSTPSYTNYNDTLQCENCGEVLWVTIKKGVITNVRSRKIDFEIPEGLPKDLEKILEESIACYEIGSFAASVVMTGLFIEGALQKTGVKKDRLVKMIQEAENEKIISNLGYHFATASRLLRNIGAHYSDELAKISDSDARLTLEMARKLAVDILDSEALSG